jgi:nicotinamidase-related amidase
MRLIKQISIFVLIAVVTTALAACEHENRPPAVKGGTTVLLLLDMQRDYLEANGHSPVPEEQAEPLIRNANALVAAMRAQEWPVLYAFNEFNPFEFPGNIMRKYAAMRFERGSAFDPRVNTASGVYFAKGDWSVFANPQFASHLKIIQCGRIVIGGLRASQSVAATAKDALKRGYSVAVISDAVADSSEQQRDATLQQLKQAGAQIETSQDFIASLSAGSQPQQG